MDYEIFSKIFDGPQKAYFLMFYFGNLIFYVKGLEAKNIQTSGCNLFNVWYFLNLLDG